MQLGSHHTSLHSGPSNPLHSLQNRYEYGRGKSNDDQRIAAIKQKYSRLLNQPTTHNYKPKVEEYKRVAREETSYNARNSIDRYPTRQYDPSPVDKRPRTECRDEEKYSYSKDYGRIDRDHDLKRETEVTHNSRKNLYDYTKDIQRSPEGRQRSYSYVPSSQHHHTSVDFAPSTTTADSKSRNLASELEAQKAELVQKLSSLKNQTFIRTSEQSNNRGTGSLDYQQILEKYSKANQRSLADVPSTNTRHRSKSCFDYEKTYERDQAGRQAQYELIQQKYSQNAQKETKAANKSTKVSQYQQVPAGKKQLSVISEISNSNHSESMQEEQLKTEKSKALYDRLSTQTKNAESQLLMCDHPSKELTTAKSIISEEAYKKQYREKTLPEQTFYKHSQGEKTSIDSIISKYLPKKEKDSVKTKENGSIDQIKLKYAPSQNTKSYEQPTKRSFIEKQSATNKPSKRDSKDITNEISKLDERIRMIEQNKKDLNITYKPFQSIQLKEDPETDPTPKATIDKASYQAKYQAYLKKVKPIYSQNTIPQHKRHSSSFSIQLHSVEEGVTTPSQQYIKQLNLEKETGTGIEERKKKLQDKHEVSSNIKLLVRVIGEQAVFDEVFRNNKIWFNGLQKADKWEELRDELEAQGFPYTLDQIKKEFTLVEAEHNPFFSAADHKCDIKGLAKTYKQAESHWVQKIGGHFNRQSLIRQGLSPEKLEAEVKGKILIEDLVRFLNIESGTFLRNRDVALIYRRLSHDMNEMTFEGLLKSVCE